MSTIVMFWSWKLLDMILIYRIQIHYNNKLTLYMITLLLLSVCSWLSVRGVLIYTYCKLIHILAQLTIRPVVCVNLYISVLKPPSPYSIYYTLYPVFFKSIFCSIVISISTSGYVCIINLCDMKWLYLLLYISVFKVNFYSFYYHGCCTVL